MSFLDAAVNWPVAKARVTRDSRGNQMKGLTMRNWLLLPWLALALAGCPADDDDDDDSAVTDDDVADDDDVTGDDDTSSGCQPEDVACEDDIILDLSLHDDKVSEGDVENTAEGDDWVSIVDATAGGYSQASQNPFIYLRFTPDGLTQVEIDDETALESMEWDVAARRYIIRLNGGTSGPSCVAAAVIPGTAYEDVTELPAGSTPEEDASYDGDCEMIDDGSGLGGSPDVALTPWWSYGDCLATTMKPFVIQLRDESLVKFVVEAYYGSGQEGCNDSGIPGQNSAMFTWRWTYLD